MNFFGYVESPIGRLMLTSDGTALTGLFMEPSRKAPQPAEGWVEDLAIAPLAAAVSQLGEYFAGAIKALVCAASLPSFISSIALSTLEACR